MKRLFIVLSISITLVFIGLSCIWKQLIQKNTQRVPSTIDRYDVMIKKARETYKQLGLEDKVTLLEGQAADVLPTLDGPYDFIFRG